MKKITPLTIALMLLSAGIGALAAILFRGDEPPPPAPVVAPAPKPEAKAPVSDIPGALERALRRRIKQLEGELAAARAPASTNAPAIPEIHPMQKQGADFRPRSPREWMENLKKNDPKRYEQMQKHFAQMRKRHFERTKGKIEFFSSIDTSGMSKEEKANHEKLQDLLAQREELPGPDDQQTDEEIRASMQKRRELDQEIRKASADERTALLRQTASALGLEGDDVSMLTETVQEVIRATETEGHGPHGPPPPAH